MIELTPAAQQKVDGYFERMRRTLSGSRTPADDVEQSVREHIEIALASASAPVGADAVGDVLDRLGPPERWIGDEERPAWRKVMDRMQSGPEDWRLAYVAFGLFFFAILLIPVGVGMLLLVPAYLLSRSNVELVRSRGESLGARRWMVLPSIALVLLFGAAFVLIAPIAAALSWLIGEHGLQQVLGTPRSMELVDQIRFDVGSGAMVAGLWWIVAAGLIAVFIRPIRFVVTPLLDRFERRHAAVLALLGAVVAGAGAAIFWV